jgi:hypothetical protein
VTILVKTKIICLLKFDFDARVNGLESCFSSKLFEIEIEVFFKCFLFINISENRKKLEMDCLQRTLKLTKR